MAGDTPVCFRGYRRGHACLLAQSATLNQLLPIYAVSWLPKSPWLCTALLKLTPTRRQTWEILQKTWNWKSHFENLYACMLAVMPAKIAWCIALFGNCRAETTTWHHGTWQFKNSIVFLLEPPSISINLKSDNLSQFSEKLKLFCTKCQFCPIPSLCQTPLIPCEQQLCLLLPTVERFLRIPATVVWYCPYCRLICGLRQPWLPRLPCLPRLAFSRTVTPKLLPHFFAYNYDRRNCWMRLLLYF